MPHSLLLTVYIEVQPDYRAYQKKKKKDTPSLQWLCDLTGLLVFVWPIYSSIFIQGVPTALTLPFVHYSVNHFS